MYLLIVWSWWPPLLVGLWRLLFVGLWGCWGCWGWGWTQPFVVDGLTWPAIKKIKMSEKAYKFLYLTVKKSQKEVVCTTIIWHCSRFLPSQGLCISQGISTVSTFFYQYLQDNLFTLLIQKTRLIELLIKPNPIFFPNKLVNI